MRTLSAAKLADNDVTLRLCDVDVTHGGGDDSKVRPSTDGVPRHQKPTGSRNDRNEAARSKRGASTADFSQQTTQDGSTQTQVTLRHCCFDSDDDRIRRNDVMMFDKATAEQPPCSVMDTTGLHLSVYNTPIQS